MKKKYYFLFSVIILSCVFYSCSRNNLNKKIIRGQLDKVADWQVENFEYSKSGGAGFLHDYGIDAWTNAVFYIGLSD